MECFNSKMFYVKKLFYQLRVEEFRDLFKVIFKQVFNIFLLKNIINCKFFFYNIKILRECP